MNKLSERCRVCLGIRMMTVFTAAESVMRRSKPHLCLTGIFLLVMSECMRACVSVQTKGELSAERKEKCETMQHNFHKLLQTSQTLAVSDLSP